MKHQAKWAGQVRHWIGWLCGVMVAVGVASQSDAEELASLVSTTFANIMGLVGIVGVRGVKSGSGKSPAKKVGEGDFG